VHSRPISVEFNIDSLHDVVLYLKASVALLTNEFFILMEMEGALLFP
jgi:hypothetical protein